MPWHGSYGRRDACPRSTTCPVDSRPLDTHPMVLDLSCVPAVVLIVEDEMMIRMRAVEMVEDAGYTRLKPWMLTKPWQSWNPGPTSR
jgi:hypothetical protein